MKSQPIILISIVLFAFAISSCTKYTSRIKGQGPVVKETVEMSSISAVSLSIDANVVLTRGDSQSVLIEGQQNIIANIEKYVTDEGMWRIGYYNSVTKHAGVTIYITSPGIDFATVSGSGNIETTNHFPGNAHVYLKISGSGNIWFSTDADIVESGISGSGQIFVRGTAREHSINISGSGNVKAFELATDNTIVRVSGSGNSEVFVQDYLNATISGSGSVFYKGNPEIEANISGSGTIINRN
jgi:hypothetical protein